jgi:DUF4097 and DUF4098 domain-containing protein YvlB
MKRLGGHAIAALLVVSASHGQPAVTVERDGLGWQEKVEQTLNLAAGDSLWIKSAQGQIDVTTGSGEQVRLRVTKKAHSFTEGEAKRLFAAMAVQSTATPGATRVTVASASGETVEGLEITVEAQVPTRCSVDLVTMGGAITVADLNGSVKALTQGGSIRVGQLTDGSFDLVTAGGSIQCQGARNGQGRARTSGGEISVGDVSGDLLVSTQGGGIAVAGVGGALEAHTAGGGIEIAAGGTRVLATTAGGSISVGSSAGPVEVSTAGGGIRIGAVAGAVKAATAGGEVVIGRADGAVEAETAGGSISIAGSGGPVKAHTTGGSIRIANAGGSIEALTTGGAIEADLALADPAADTHCDLETLGGDLTLTLPPTLSATVDAEVTVDGWWSRNCTIHTDFPLTVKGEASRRVTAAGTLNGGGDLVRLRTTNGDINLRRR